MAERNLNLPAFPPFNMTEGTSMTWTKYKKRFGLLCAAIGVTEQQQKLSMFLTYVGDEVYEVYENVLTEEETTYDQVMGKLDEYFKPKINISYETYLFRLLKQNEEESLQQFHVRLKEQATKCNFHDSEREIKQQIELFTKEPKLRLYAFRNPEKNLQDLLMVGKTLEQTLMVGKTLE